MNADLIVSGGEVLDPGAGLTGRLDIAIRNGRVVDVAADLASRYQGTLLDVSGAFVFPGLVDIHTHCYWGGTCVGLRPDPFSSTTGVTTWIDAGSAGAWNLAGFRELIIERSQARVRAFVNISGIGLTASAPFTHELDNMSYCNQGALRRVLDAHNDIVVGIKVRMGNRANGIEPLRLALETAEAAHLPVMVHIGDTPPDVTEIFALLRPGDIVTHCYHDKGMRLVSDSGVVLEQALDARERGILFDVGHGRTDFSWRVAEALLAQGFVPDVISSDISWVSVGAPNVDLPTSMTKFLHLGLSISDILRCVTDRAASAVRLAEDVGTLRPGARADLAVFRIAEGSFPLRDSMGEERIATRAFQHQLTIIRGQPLAPVRTDPPPPYIENSADILSARPGMSAN
jgi:dihydroorotase